MTQKQIENKLAIALAPFWYDILQSINPDMAANQFALSVYFAWDCRYKAWPALSYVYNGNSTTFLHRRCWKGRLRQAGRNLEELAKQLFRGRNFLFDIEEGKTRKFLIPEPTQEQVRQGEAWTNRLNARDQKCQQANRDNVRLHCKFRRYMDRTVREYFEEHREACLANDPPIAKISWSVVGGSQDGYLSLGLYSGTPTSNGYVYYQHVQSCVVRREGEVDEDFACDDLMRELWQTWRRYKLRRFCRRQTFYENKMYLIEPPQVTPTPVSPPTTIVELDPPF
jgi:hypothetical protein